MHSPAASLDAAQELPTEPSVPPAPLADPAGPDPAPQWGEGMAHGTELYYKQLLAFSVMYSTLSSTAPNSWLLQDKLMQGIRERATSLVVFLYHHFSSCRSRASNPQLRPSLNSSSNQTLRSQHRQLTAPAAGIQN